MTGSLALGSPHIRCCLWLAALPFRRSVEVPLCHHLLPAVSRITSHEVDAPFHSPLCRHSVGPAGGSVFAELDMSLYDPCLCVCRQLLAFSPTVHRTTSNEGEMYFLPQCFKLFLILCCYFYGFLRELDLAFGRSSDRVETHSFHGQTRWAKLHDLAPDIQDAMELWALEPDVILVKVKSVCGLHIFFHQYVADLREWKLQNVFRTVSTSPLVFNRTVMRTSGAIATPPEVPVGKIMPLTTVVSTIDDVSTVTPFVVPPPPDIERPVMQLHNFLTCRTPESRQSSLLCSLSASSSALTLPRNPAKFLLSSFSLDRFQPPTGEALLPPPADDCLVPDLDDQDTSVQFGTFPASEYPSSLPACATIRPEGSSTTANVPLS